MQATGKGKGHIVTDGKYTSELNRTHSGNIQIIHNKAQEYYLEILQKQNNTFDVKHISYSFIKQVDKIFANMIRLNIQDVHINTITQNRLHEIASGQEMTETEAIAILEFIRTKQYEQYPDDICAKQITNKKQATDLLNHFDKITHKVFKDVPPEKWSYQGEGHLTTNGFTFNGYGTYVKNMDYGEKRIYTGNWEKGRLPFGTYKLKNRKGAVEQQYEGQFLLIHESEISPSLGNIQFFTKKLIITIPVVAGNLISHKAYITTKEHPNTKYHTTVTLNEDGTLLQSGDITMEYNRKKLTLASRDLNLTSLTDKEDTVVIRKAITDQQPRKPITAENKMSLNDISLLIEYAQIISSIMKDLPINDTQRQLFTDFYTEDKAAEREFFRKAFQQAKGDANLLDKIIKQIDILSTSDKATYYDSFFPEPHNPSTSPSTPSSPLHTVILCAFFPNAPEQGNTYWANQCTTQPETMVHCR